MIRAVLALAALLALGAVAQAAPAPDGNSSAWTVDAAGSTTCASGALTTSSTNDVIILFTMSNGSHVSSVADTAGLTWQSRKTLQNGASGNYNEMWWAISAAALTGDVVTPTFTAAGTFNGCLAIGVKGANTAAPFDRAGALPGTTASATVPPLATTDGYDDLIVGFIRQNAASAPGAGTGFTALGTNTGSFSVVEYTNVVAAQTNLSVPSSTGSSDIFLGIADAIVAADAYTTAAFASKTQTYGVFFLGNFTGPAASKANSYAVLMYGPQATKILTYAVLIASPSGFFVHSLPP